MDELNLARSHQEMVRDSEHTIHEDEHWAAEHRGTAALPSVSVYSADAVFWVTFLINVLAGFVVSAINWSRLESHARARVHIIIGAVLFVGLAVLIAWLQIGLVLLLPINLAAAWYLRNQTQNDIYADAGVTRRIETANAWSAVGIGIGSAIVMFFLALILHPAVT